MVTCPNCNNSLPDWAQNCQFCQADVRAIPRAKAAERKVNYYEAPKWVWIAYYVIAVYFLAGGGIDIAVAATGKEGPSIFGIIFGAISVILGLGLILRIELIRGIVNFFCALQILGGLLGLAGTLLGMVLVGPFAIIFLLLNVIDIVTGGLMIYLIGETDRGANI